MIPLPPLAAVPSWGHRVVLVDIGMLELFGQSVSAESPVHQERTAGTSSNRCVVPSKTVKNGRKTHLLFTAKQPSGAQRSLLNPYFWCKLRERREA